MAGAIPSRPGEELIINSLAACARHAFDGDQVEQVAEVNIRIRKTARQVDVSRSLARPLCRLDRHHPERVQFAAFIGDRNIFAGYKLCAPKR